MFSSVNEKELSKFRALADEWWDPSGKGGAGIYM
jgi:2-polyprenyl-3-methyl-5-hydroxy-6-metoxy-1,4-benzoquinol methylase